MQKLRQLKLHTTDSIMRERDAFDFAALISWCNDYTTAQEMKHTRKRLLLY